VSPSSHDQAAAAHELRQLLLRHVPPSWRESDLTDDLPLGAEGLGLDSVAMVEFLIACEQRWHLAFPMSLLEQPVLTVGTLLEHLRNALGSRRG